MAITLDPDVEQRIERELARGRFADLNELMVHAMSLVEAEAEGAGGDADAEDWLLRNRDFVRAAIAESMAEAERGEGYSPEESRALLAKDREERRARAA